MRSAGLLLLMLMASPSLEAEVPLVILRDTGERRDNLPVLAPHPEAATIRARLEEGFPGRLLRLYSLVQDFLARHGDGEPEPAYLLLSQNQGGFPRYGFYLEEIEKSQVAYVDLHESSPITGRFGAVDQIFPHEMGHILIRQLTGGLEGGGANQIHATGVRTDPVVAFNEGFAAHFQIMALDDPGAPPQTAALRHDREARLQARSDLLRYRRELEAWWAPGSPQRMRFLFWFSQSEDVLRYHAVKSNAFAHVPKIPPHLYSGRGLYNAYLLANVLPGETSQPVKSASILLSTEGVVSYLFHRWVNESVIRQSRPQAGFYDQFGVSSDRVPPLENAYLKLFYVFERKRPQRVTEVVEAYCQIFPDEGAAVRALLAETLHGQEPPRGPEIWLANPDFQTGTSLFDQFRGLPRIHTFDLNAASIVDLMGVPGMDLERARQIIQAAPLADLDQLRELPGITPSLFDKFRWMGDQMEILRNAEEETDLSLQSILLPYLWRALLVLAISALLGALLQSFFSSLALWRLLLNGLAASLLLLTVAWLIRDGAGWPCFLAPVLVFGVPAAFWKLAQKKQGGPALRVLASWAAAALPAAAAVHPWF